MASERQWSGLQDSWCVKQRRCIESLERMVCGEKQKKMPFISISLCQASREWVRETACLTTIAVEIYSRSHNLSWRLWWPLTCLPVSFFTLTREIFVICPVIALSWTKFSHEFSNSSRVKQTHFTVVHRTPWPGPPASSLCIVLQPHGLLVIHEWHQDHATLPHCGHLLLRLQWGLPLDYNFCSFRTSLNVTISESPHSFPTILYPSPGSSHWHTCI